MWQGKPMIPACDVENKMLWCCNNCIFRQCPLKEMENKSLGMERKCRELLELKAIMILVRVYVCNGKKFTKEDCFSFIQWSNNSTDFV